MPLVVCQDCRQQVSDRAEACPSCGRPMRGRASEGGWALEMAAVVGVFGVLSMAYAFFFPEDELVVSEMRLKFWFGFQLVTMAFALLALRWWKQARPLR